jgi:hypothetical protein
METGMEKTQRFRGGKAALPLPVPTPGVSAKKRHPQAPGHPGRRSAPQPLLIKQWKYLWRREIIELRRGDAVIGTGYVDEATADAGTIWIHMTQGLGRVLIHHGDGIEIWRIDPRICQNRVQP